MSGGRKQAQPAVGRPLYGNAKGLLTFGQRRRSAKMGGVRSHQSAASEGGSPGQGYPRRSAAGRAVEATSAVLQRLAVPGSGQVDLKVDQLRGWIDWRDCAQHSA